MKIRAHQAAVAFRIFLLIGAYVLSVGPVMLAYGEIDALDELIGIVYYPLVKIVDAVDGDELLDSYVAVFNGWGIYVRRYTPNEYSISGALKTLNGMFATYRKKGYHGMNTYPVGNDDSLWNNGKFCGLYYEQDKTGERITLIGENLAQADWRSHDWNNGGETCGWYYPHADKPEIQVDDFSIQPFCGYWFALMKFIELEDGTLQPYDKEYSKDSYALVAWPAEYGVTGEYTLIINEEGTVYSMDRGESTYLDTYPTVTPGAKNWEIWD